MLIVYILISDTFPLLPYLWSILSFKIRSLIPSLLQPQVSHEDSLTYAELELVRPRPEPPASLGPDPAASGSDTVYAQIVFQEKQL